MKDQVHPRMGRGLVPTRTSIFGNSQTVRAMMPGRVIVAIVAATCLVLALFLSGVWVGVSTAAPAWNIEVWPHADCAGWLVFFQGSYYSGENWRVKVDDTIIQEGTTTGNKTVTGNWPTWVNLSTTHTFRAEIKEGWNWLGRNWTFGGNCGPESCRDVILDFDANASGQLLPAGTMITDQWADLGIHVSADNARSGGPDVALIFDSANPTGGDTDLGTPNQGFGGPGVGSGGQPQQPGQNARPRGNVLIIAENVTDGNNDGLVDSPDDELEGGTLSFAFDNPAHIISVELIDVEDGTTVVAYDGNGGTLRTVNVASRGDNGVQTVYVDATGVRRLDVNLSGTGAVSQIVGCLEGGGASPGCVTFQRGSYGTVADTYIWQSHPYDNKGTYSSLYTGDDNGHKQSLLRFDLSEIPVNATIDSATFSIYRRDEGGYTGNVNVYRILNNWAENSVTWHSFNGGYDHGTVWGAFSANGTGFVDTDLTSLVQAWVDGTYPNRGILLDVAYLISGKYKKYKSSDYDCQSCRPKLEVCYTTGPVPSIQVSKTLVEPAGGATGVGATVTFSITITNTGSVDITHLPLQDTYDTAQLSYQGASPSSDDNNDDGVINWSDLTGPAPYGFGGNLPPGDSYSVTVNFQAKATTGGSGLMASAQSEHTTSTNSPLAEGLAPDAPNCYNISPDVSASCQGWSVDFQGSSCSYQTWTAFVDGKVIDTGQTMGNETVTGSWPADLDLGTSHEFKVQINGVSDSTTFGPCETCDLARVSGAQDAGGHIAPAGEDQACVIIRSALGDRVWLDEDANGIQDAGELGINDVLVNLYKDNGDGICNPSTDTFEASQYTAGDGIYLFTYLPAGDYCVQVDDSNFDTGGPLEGLEASPQDQGTDDAVDSDGATTSPYVTTKITLPAGVEDRTWDFGYHCLVAGNVSAEVKNTAAQPLVGFTVNLYQDLGTIGTFEPGVDQPLDTETTGSDGIATFPDQGPGHYILQVSDQGGYTFDRNYAFVALTCVSGAEVEGFEGHVPTAVTLADFSARAPGTTRPWTGVLAGAGLVGLALVGGTLTLRRRR